jgi:PhnB protein
MVAASGKGDLTITPYICVKGAAEAIEFYKTAFDATEEYRLNGEDGRIGHADLTIGDAKLMLADEAPAFGALAPPTIGGTPVRLHIYVPDVDATVKKAEKAGAIVLRPVEDQFYGDRSGLIADPFGHQWFVATRKKDVSAEAMQEHYTQSFKG